jgi:hypothetical protein
MFSARYIKTAALLTGAALALAPAVALAGVVVASSGPSAKSYPVGRTIGDNDRIVLKAGDTLTVLAGSGTRVLRGAGTFTLGQDSGPGRTGAFALLTRQRSASRMRTGAVRSGDVGGPVTRPNLWYVDVAAPGAMCLPATDEVRLWRPTNQGAATYRVKPEAGGKAIEVTFNDGDMLGAWDQAALPVADDASYVISGPGNASTTVRFKLLGDVPEQPEALAEQLIRHGCSAQLQLLSSTMMTPAG